MNYQLNKTFHFLEIKLSAEEICKEEEEKARQAISSKTSFSHVSTEHPFRLATKPIVDFPVKDLIRYRIFKDLWHKGYYITSAENFGGDFLLYSHDPIYFHASKIVHIVKYDEMLDPTVITSFGRIAVSVKKKCVFAYINDNDDSITYQTLEWDNPKLKELYSTANNLTNEAKSGDDEDNEVAEISNVT